MELSTHITVGAAIEGTAQLLEPFVKKIRKIYVVSNVEYDTKDNISWVKFNIKSGLGGTKELSALVEIASCSIDVDPEDILNMKIKQRRIVLARRIVMVVLRYRLKLSSVKVAKLFSCNHASVLYACRKFNTKNLTIFTCSLEEAYTIVKRRCKK